MLTKLTPAPTQRTAMTPFDVIRGEMDRVFNDWLGEFGAPVLGTAEMAAFVPRIDVKEDDKQLLLTAELPGLEAKDVEVELDRDFLLLKGHKEEKKEEKNDRFYSRERRYGSFERRLQLPWNVDDGAKLDASFKNGVLSVVVPKPKEVANGRKKIAVKVG